jgi:hypothetical protein
MVHTIIVYSPYLRYFRVGANVAGGNGSGDEDEGDDEDNEEKLLLFQL